MRHMSGRSRSGTRGLAMTEMAIVLPVALLLILATAELGRAFWQYNTLTKSVRDAARYATTEGLWSTGTVIITDELRGKVQNLVVYGNTAGSGEPLLNGLTTSGVSIEAPGEDDILVRTTYAYEPIFGLLPTFHGGALSAFFEFEAVVRMRTI